MEPYVQHKLLEMVHGLNASVEALLQPSRHIELEVKVRPLAQTQAHVGRCNMLHSEQGSCI